MVAIAINVDKDDDENAESDDTVTPVKALESRERHVASHQAEQSARKAVIQRQVEQRTPKWIVYKGVDHPEQLRASRAKDPRPLWNRGGSIQQSSGGRSEDAIHSDFGQQQAVRAAESSLLPVAKCQRVTAPHANGAVVNLPVDQHVQPPINLESSRHPGRGANRPTAQLRPAKDEECPVSTHTRPKRAADMAAGGENGRQGGWRKRFGKERETLV